MLWIVTAILLFLAETTLALGGKSCCQLGGDKDCKIKHPDGCRQCYGNYIRLCENGTWNRTNCGINQVCVPAFGNCQHNCALIQTNLHEMCQKKPPGCQECEGDNLKNCGEDGLWSIASCGSGLKCISGNKKCEVQCVPIEKQLPLEKSVHLAAALEKCTPGCQECKGYNFQKCGDDGTWNAMCCGNGLKCIAGSNACEIQCALVTGTSPAPIITTSPAPVPTPEPTPPPSEVGHCTKPGERKCEGHKARKCHQNNTWVDDECGPGLTCTPGPPGEIVCTPVPTPGIVATTPLAPAQGTTPPAPAPGTTPLAPAPPSL